MTKVGKDKTENDDDDDYTSLMSTKAKIEAVMMIMMQRINVLLLVNS